MNLGPHLPSLLASPPLQIAHPPALTMILVDGTTMADHHIIIPGAYCQPAPRILMRDVLVVPLVKKQVRVVGKGCCNFCKKNGETIESYTSHRLRNEKGLVECPILRSHVCKFCNESGDNAHTISYCPYASKLAPIIEELGAEDATVNMGDLRRTQFSAAGQRQSLKKPSVMKKQSSGKLNRLIANLVFFRPLAHGMM